jgi:transposase-like protein
MDPMEVIRKQLESMKCPSCGSSVRLVKRGTYYTDYCGCPEFEKEIQKVMNPQIGKK